MKSYQRWAKLAALNLLIVASIGVVLRYKIAFSLPMIDHKFLLYGHSHFAFNGWVSLALFTGIVACLRNQDEIPSPSYQGLFWMSQIASFGMLFTFPFMGYQLPSILFSTLAIVFSYLFTGYAWRDFLRKRIPSMISRWFKAGLAFFCLSSLGAFYLAWLMSSRSLTQDLYIGSVYFFLHFQYNGWFLFAIFGLFFYQMDIQTIKIQGNSGRFLFQLLFYTCLPAFLLSALWMKLPNWLYWLATIAGWLQALALFLLWRLILPVWKQLKENLHPVTWRLWQLSFLALNIKFILQLLSTIPTLSHFAFGFRSLVIGYLHLVMLGFVSLFLIGYLVQQNFLSARSRTAITGIIIFVTGVIINEVLLMAQGINAIEDKSIPAVNDLLFGAALIMFGGLLCFLIFQWKDQKRFA